jgi:hypothetical protein
MLDHRLHVLVDQERYQKLTREAERRGVSVARIIREAIDRLPTCPPDRQAAIAAILAAEPMPLPKNVGDLRRELDAAHDRVAG